MHLEEVMCVIQGVLNYTKREHMFMEDNIARDKKFSNFHVIRNISFCSRPEA